MISPEQRKGLRTWVEVDRTAIAHNYQTFRTLIGTECKMMAVVKSNAYGHSLIDFSNEIARLGADWLGVDSVVEGLALRREGITLPILVLGFTLPEMFKEAAEHDISVTVSTLTFFEFLKNESFSKKLKVHVKVDTGMHRQGFMFHQKEALFIGLDAAKDRVVIEGLYTHFAAAKDPSSLKYTLNQTEEFVTWKTAFATHGLTPITHASATAGTILYPDSRFDMVRIGAGLYGLWPSVKMRKRFEKKVPLELALTWKTLIAEIKYLSEDSGIGYDLAEKLKRDSMIAICPVGYWHGFSRSLSGIGEVLVKGERCKVLGRVSMDMIVIDVSDVVKPTVLDEVVIIGTDGPEEMTPYEFADKSPGASTYESLTRINPLIKRLYY